MQIEDLIFMKREIFIKIVLPKKIVTAKKYFKKLNLYIFNGKNEINRFVKSDCLQFILSQSHSSLLIMERIVWNNERK